MSETYTVGIVGLGAIGLQLARALDAGVPGLKLAAVAVRDRDKAVAAMKGFRDRPLVLDIAKLPRECDIIVEAAPAAAFAGIGPERTQVEVWADPALDRNTHTIVVDAAAARLTMTIENVPTETNPRTGKITALSILACLRGLTSTLKVGS